MNGAKRVFCKSRTVTVRSLACATVIVLTAATVSSGGLFFGNGATAWKIYLSPQAADPEVFAAEELRSALKEISGAEFEVVVSESIPDSNAIVIGDLNHPKVREKASALGLAEGKVEEVAVYTFGDNLYLASGGCGGVFCRGGQPAG